MASSMTARQRGQLHRALLVHLCMAPVYALWCALGLLSQFWWDAILMQAFTFTVVALLMVHWSRQERTSLVPRVVGWALLSWTTPLGLPFLVLIPWTRRLLVPPLVDSERWPIWTTTGSVW